MWQQIQQAAVLLALGLVMVLTPRPAPAEEVKDIDHAWVKLFDKKFEGERLSINYPRDVRDFRNLLGDRGREGSREGGNNMVSSAHYAIPRGWALRLYTGLDFRGDHFDLRGTGRDEKKMLPEDVRNKISSAKWVRLDDRDRDRDYDWDRGWRRDSDRD